MNNKANKSKNSQNQMKSQEEVIVKKINAYPFTVNITGAPGAAPIRAQIVKLTEIGFLCKTNVIFKVHDNFECQFEIPTFHKTFQCPIKVIKTYDMLEHQGELLLGKMYIMEAHFRNEDELRKKEVLKFLEQIKQKK